jgi:hypothetical protein
MECMGAVIALGNKTNHLDEKIEKLEECLNDKNKKFENENVLVNFKDSTLKVAQPNLDNK